jgi:hypothetical protein
VKKVELVGPCFEDGKVKSPLKALVTRQERGNQVDTREHGEEQLIRKERNWTRLGIELKWMAQDRSGWLLSTRPVDTMFFRTTS